MAENYEPKPGDRVRVVIEAEVDSVRPYRVVFAGRDDLPGRYTEVLKSQIVSVEKVEPPVEVFEPGDTVRNKMVPDFVYSIGHGGFYAHRTGHWYECKSEFTSSDYERVELR